MQNFIFSKKILLLFICLPSVFCACSDKSGDYEEERKSEIEFLKKEEPALTSDWGNFNIPDGNVFSRGILIGNASQVYPGAVFSQSALLEGKFVDESTLARNAYDIEFDIWRTPQKITVAKGEGIAVYRKGIEQTVNSDGYQHMLKEDKKGSGSEDSSFESYKELKKSFLGRSDIGKLVINAAYNNSKALKKVNGRMFYSLIERYFTVEMEMSEKGVFEDAKNNLRETHKESEQPVVVRRITYGKVLFAIVESEYAREDVSWAFSEAYNYGFNDAKIRADRTISKIFDKTVITAYLLSGDSYTTVSTPITIGQFGKFYYGRRHEGDLYGTPIFADCNYVYNNSIFPAE